jgi:hypothetical protein
LELHVALVPISYPLMVIGEEIEFSHSCFSEVMSILFKLIDKVEVYESGPDVIVQSPSGEPKVRKIETREMFCYYSGIVDITLQNHSYDIGFFDY